MSNIISNFDDVIDSRDIMERIEELETELEEMFNDGLGGREVPIIFEEWLEVIDSEEKEEHQLLKALAEEAEQYSDDWKYGCSLIRESHFEEYMDEMVGDCYELPKDMPWWMSIKLDYEALKQDYTEIEFDGVTYYIR